MLKAARLGIVVLYWATLSAQAQSPADLTPEQWRADLRFFAEELPKRHKNLFFKTPREKFEAAVAALDARIPALQRYQIIVELARIVALVGDGHTRMPVGFDPKMGFREYPLQLYLFADGLFVKAGDVKADPSYARAVGARVLRIGKATPEEAYAAVRELVPHDNEMWVNFIAPRFLAIPEVLGALNIVDDMETAPFLLEKDGRRFTVEFHPVAANPDREMHVFENRGWADMRDGAAAPTPLWLKHPTSVFWYEYLPDSRTVYVQYNSVTPQDGETPGEFFGKVMEFVHANPVDRLVLDMRLNGGGNNFFNKPIIHALIRDDKVNRRGKLFTVIGRRTFSAAQNCVNELEEHTNTLFVGEPTGTTPNHYGDAEPIVLPNSGLTVQASTLWWQDVDPRDRRPWTAPQIAVDLTSADYRANRDPVLAAILEYADRPSLPDQVRASVERGDRDAARKAIRHFRSDPVNRYYSPEAEINTLGYTLMGQHQIDLAIAVFQLNVEAFPDSANTYDSLGEAYMNKGERELAIKNYEKSLELNPRNFRARRALERLRR